MVEASFGCIESRVIHRVVLHGLALRIAPGDSTVFVDLTIKSQLIFHVVMQRHSEANKLSVLSYVSCYSSFFLEISQKTLAAALSTVRFKVRESHFELFITA